MNTFETPAPITADIDIEAGRARVIARDRTTTVVDVRPANDRRRADVEAAERTRVEMVGDRLEVRASRPRYLGLLGKPGAIEVIVQLPTGSHLRGQVAYGDVDVEGQVGDCRVKTSYGNLRVDAAAAVELHTSGGDVTIGRATGPIDAGSSWGNIRVGEAVATTTLKTAGGDILVQKAAAPVDARTSYGDVRVAEASSGTLALSTSYGNVAVGVTAGTATFLDLTCGFGNVHNQLTQSDDDRGDQGKKLVVRAHTKYGDITISRA